MGLKGILSNSMLANYGKAIRTAPHEVIFNRNLLLSVFVYAMTAVPAVWDQGSSAVVPSLPGFQEHFHLTSGANAGQIKNFISIIYIGYAVGAASSFLINDRIGRLWSFRLYIVLYIIGQLVAVFAPGKAGLYAARIVSGLGIGALTVTGPMSIVEIAPAEIRGLLTAWFNVAMSMSLVSGIFCVLGVYEHVPTSNLQFQIVWFSPCIYMVGMIGVSLFICDSPRWLFLVGRRDEAVQTLLRLRGLPLDHARVQVELTEIEDHIGKEKEDHTAGFLGILKEAFCEPSNLRRVQQTLISYALAQLSGANSITSYFVPILKLMGLGGGTTRSLFLSGMYGLSKFFFTIIASFFFIDALGRRKSLFVGITLQMISDIYVGVYIKYKQEGTVSNASSQGALAFIFIHAFGYCVGLLILPYVFGAELWPNRIRSFGGALSASFHWLFIYAMQSGVPSLLKQTDNWGAFIFFATWCFIALFYVFLMVPETAGLSVEEIDHLFKGPWFNAYKRSKQAATMSGVEAGTSDDLFKEGSKVVVEMKNSDKSGGESRSAIIPSIDELEGAWHGPFSS